MFILTLTAVAGCAFMAGVHFQKTRQLEAIVSDLLRPTATSVEPTASPTSDYNEELDLYPDRIG